MAENGPAVAAAADPDPEPVAALGTVCTPGVPDTTADADGPCPAWAGFFPGLKTVLAGFPAPVMIVAWTAGCSGPWGSAACGDSADPVGSAGGSVPTTASKEIGRVNSRPSRTGVKPSGSTEDGSGPVAASAGAGSAAPAEAAPPDADPWAGRAGVGVEASRR